MEEQERRIETEEKERTTRKAKAEQLERSWDLLNLCREVMDKEGLSWKKSKERRDEERRRETEKREKLAKASRKSEEARYNHKCKQIQSKITTELKKIPQNGRVLL